MKSRVRQLKNGKWVPELRRWHDFRWHGVLIGKVSTLGSVGMGVTDFPRPQLESPGDIHYPLTFCDTESGAQEILDEALTILTGTS